MSIKNLKGFQSPVRARLLNPNFNLISEIDILKVPNYYLNAVNKPFFINVGFFFSDQEKTPIIL